jgi:drug/metabolite transporter (DMT)-like permease
VERAWGGVPAGLRLMAAGAFSFSVMAALLKAAGTSLPLFEIVAGRSLVVALIAGFGVWRQGHSFFPAEWRLVLLRALFGFIALSCYFYSIIHLPLADATAIYFTNPVLTALVAAAVLREHMGWREIALVLLSLLGVVAVARPGFLFGAERALDTTAVALGLVSALFAAASYVTIRGIRRAPPLLVVFWFGAVTVVLCVPIIAGGWVGVSALDVLLLVGIGVATHVGQLCITWAFRMERAGAVSAVGYLQIVFAATWGWLFFAEMPDRWTWLGAAVIVVATFGLTRLHPTPEPSAIGRTR